MNAEVTSHLLKDEIGTYHVPHIRFIGDKSMLCLQLVVLSGQKLCRSALITLLPPVNQTGQCFLHYNSFLSYHMIFISRPSLPI